MKRLASILALSILLSGCGFLGIDTDPKGATKALEQAGYSDITITGYHWSGCSKDNHYHTGFKAKGPTGVPADGVVCKNFGIFFSQPSSIHLD